MPDEMNALAQEPAEPAIEEESVTAAIEEPVEPAIDDADEQTGNGEGDDADPAEDEDELEFGFKKYRVPKSLKEGIEGLRKDYTLKTEALSHRTKEAEQQIAAKLQASEKELEQRSELFGLTKQIEQYQKVDWQGLQQEDPIGAQSHWFAYQNARDRAQQLGGELQQMENERLQTTQQETAKRIEATREFAQKQIKGWSPEVDAKVTEFATSVLGFSPQEVVAAVNPAIYQTLHLAWIGHQSVQKQLASHKPASQPVQPLQTVSGKSGVSPRKSLADMSMDEYAAARQAGRA